MSKVLFINGCAHGHINPTLPLVKELVDRGEEVFYVSAAEFRDKVVSNGANYIDIGEKFAQFNRSFKLTGSHPFYSVVDYFLKSDMLMVPLILEKIVDIKPDYIIHDSIFGGGNIIGKLLNIPSICSCTTFAMNKLPLPPHMFERGFHPELDALYYNLDNAAKELGVGELTLMDVFFKKEELNIVYTSKAFQPDPESFDESFKFVGPSIGERNELVNLTLEDLDGNDVVYISMGTINNDNIEFYNKCIEAFKGEEMKVVLSIGKKSGVERLQSIPDNFIIRDYVPQLEVLKRADVFISHAGMNSVTEALYFEVPIVAIPQANDQHMIARQIVMSGAGISLKADDITPEQLTNSVAHVLSESKFKETSRRIGKSFREAGGYKAAVEYIFEYKKIKSL
ncbi:MAG: glycosyltransferase [Bacillota bacterium]|nr:glycosyltransferase [Bacillota bacterium]